MNDMISRRVAIDTFEKELSAKYNKRDLAIGFVGVERILRNLPSEEPHWIPVTERLPNSSETVIVSVCDETGDTRFDYSAHGWVTTDKEYWIVDDEINNYVVAWMPLPEPWKGEEDG